MSPHINFPRFKFKSSVIHIPVMSMESLIHIMFMINSDLSPQNFLFIFYAL